MKKGMIVGVFVFIGYICSINYIFRNKICSYHYDTESEDEIESEKEDIQLEIIETETETETGQPNEQDKQEIECEENECEENECEEIECEENVCEENECEEDECKESNLRVLFDKKKYMIELDKELADIKDKLEEIRNNLHNFN